MSNAINIGLPPLTKQVVTQASSTYEVEQAIAAASVPSFTISGPTQFNYYSGATVPENTTVTLHVICGDSAYKVSSYQWQYPDDDGNLHDIDGATTSSITIAYDAPYFKGKTVVVYVKINGKYLYTATLSKTIAEDTWALEISGISGISYATFGACPEPFANQTFTAQLLINGVVASEGINFSWVAAGNLSIDGAADADHVTTAIAGVEVSGDTALVCIASNGKRSITAKKQLAISHYIADVKTWNQAAAPTIGMRPNALNGDIWYNTTSNKKYRAISNSWVEQPLDIPAISGIVANSDGSITLNFSSSDPLFSKFNIYRSVDGDKYAVVGVVAHNDNSTDYSFLDKNTSQGQIYYYKISAVYVNGDETALSSPASITSSISATPNSPTSVSAVADNANAIRLSAVAPASDNPLYKAAAYRWLISRDSGGTWAQLPDTKDAATLYYYDRSVDKFPESADLSKYRFRVYTVSTYGLASSGYSTTAVDYSSYGTWIPSIPTLSSHTSGRAAFVGWDAQANLYGIEEYRIQISKDKISWYTPTSGDDAYTNENGWYTGAVNSYLVQTAVGWNQSLPLAGQTSNLPVDTTYFYRVARYNATTGVVSDYVSATCIATATGAKDIVAKAITEAALDDECVTVAKIAAKAVTANKIYVTDLAAITGVFGKIANNIVAADANNYWNLETGAFQLSNGLSGDSAAYLKFDGTSISMKLNQLLIDSVASKIKGNFKVITSAGSLSNPTDNQTIFDVNPDTPKITMRAPLEVQGSLSAGSSLFAKGNFKVITTAGSLTSPTDAQTIFDVNPDTPKITMRAPLSVKGGDYNIQLGNSSKSWGGGTNYPTIYSDAADMWVMYINPHIPYVTTPGMSGAGIRLASDASATHSWDVGIGKGGEGVDTFAIARDNVGALTINNSKNVYLNKNLFAGEDIYTNAKYARHDGKMGVVIGSGSIEISHPSTPHIDFNFGNSTADYTSRIIESSSGLLEVTGSLQVDRTFHSVLINDFTDFSNVRSDYCPFNQGWHTVANDNVYHYLPLLGTCSIVANQGYANHVVIGEYRYGNAGWNGGLFIGNGGNDEHITSCFYINSLGNTINHSAGGWATTGHFGVGGNFAYSHALYVTGSQYVTGSLATGGWIFSGGKGDQADGHSGVSLNPDGGIEISHASTPYIDFHYANSTADYTSRIYEGASGVLTITGALAVNNGITSYGGLEIRESTPHIDFHYNYATSSYTSRIIESASGTLTVLANLDVHGKLYGNFAGTVYPTGHFGVESASQRVSNLVVTLLAYCKQGHAYAACGYFKSVGNNIDMWVSQVKNVDGLNFSITGTRPGTGYEITLTYQISTADTWTGSITII